MAHMLLFTTTLAPTTGELITELLTLLSGKKAAVEYTVMSTPMEGVEPEERRDPGANKVKREAGSDTEARLVATLLLLLVFTLMPAEPNSASIQDCLMPNNDSIMIIIILFTCTGSCSEPHIIMIILYQCGVHNS